MKRIHLDAVGGIAGDMFVAAMLDAFPELRDRVLSDTAAALPQDVGVPRLFKSMNGSLSVSRFDLERAVAHDVNGHAQHSHNHTHCTAAYHGHFLDLVERIEQAPLSEGTSVRAKAILTILAEAEALVHGVSLNEVHFHEIADWDSLMDVVAAGSIAAALKDWNWTVSPLPIGGGLVQTQHGLLPIPAPATALILKGFEWRNDGIVGERVTPTGAAIVAHLINQQQLGPRGRLRRIGMGAGTRELPNMPNILRVLSFEESATSISADVTVLSFEIDDMTGEEIGVAADRLRGLPDVLDLTLGERWGKKGRPVQSFSLLVRPESTTQIAERCFAETSTIGLRMQQAQRMVLDRTVTEVEGIGVKRVRRPQGISVKAECDHLLGDNLETRRRAKHRAEQVND